jgi:uncharacterized protein
MTPQERQLIEDLFDRLSRLEGTPRDPEAAGAISQGLSKAPNAPYALVQTVLVQDEALKRANTRIQQLESAGIPSENQSGGFLDTMRETIFGQTQAPRGSVPNVPPPEAPSRPVWNSGQVMQQAQPGQYGQASYGQPYGAPQPPPGGGGSFLGTAAAAAAGMVGGSLLLGSIRSMMGGSHHGFGDPSAFGGSAQNQTPWADQSGSTLAHDAGIDDISGPRDRADDGSRAGLFDTASNDDDDDHDDMDDVDANSDDGGGDDGGSNYA